MKSDCDTFNVIRVNEWRNNKTGMTTVRAYRNPTREELVAEARAAFSNHNTERLYDVMRSRDNITGSTMEIIGRFKPLYNPYYKSYQVPNEKNFLKKFQEQLKMKPKEFMHERLENFRNMTECISDRGKTKLAEWTGELTKYSDSIGTIYVKNKVPKETTLRKVLNAIRHVK